MNQLTGSLGDFFEVIPQGMRKNRAERDGLPLRLAYTVPKPFLRTTHDQTTKHHANLHDARGEDL